MKKLYKKINKDKVGTKMLKITVTIIPFHAFRSRTNPSERRAIVEQVWFWLYQVHSGHRKLEIEGSSSKRQAIVVDTIPEDVFYASPHFHCSSRTALCEESSAFPPERNNICELVSFCECFKMSGFCAQVFIKVL